MIDMLFYTCVEFNFKI